MWICLVKCLSQEDVTGTLTKKSAGLLGLSTDCLVVGGAGDCAANALGTGVVRSGIVVHLDWYFRRYVRSQ